MDNDSEKMLLEILKMARDLVINEHVERRARDHNAWVYESERLWLTRKIKLQYPEIPQYPTEKEIVERAQVLLKFVVLGSQHFEQQANINLESNLSQQPVIEQIAIANEVSDPEVVEQVAAEITNQQVIEEVFEEVVQDVFDQAEKQEDTQNTVQQIIKQADDLPVSGFSAVLKKIGIKK